MKKNIIKIIGGVILLSGFAACTDSWNDHYEINPNTVQKSLWEQIKADPELSDFAEILDSAYYYTAVDKRSSMKYSELLAQNSKYTVWAPKNNTFNKEYWLKLCHDDPYNMQQRFIKNHVSLFSKAIGGSEIDSMTMLNGKMYLLDNSVPQLKDAQIEKTIGAKNGIVYVLNDTVPFLSNLYEYISQSTVAPKLTAYFDRYDTTYFDANQSTQGPIIDGSVTYVDSVTYTYNNLFSFGFDDNGNTRYGLNAQLNSEDSLYVMVIPTDAAWNEATIQIAPYFKYLSEYANKVEENGNNIKVNGDSIQQAQTEMAIVNNLAFSLNTQGKNLAGFHQKDSVVTTTDVKIPYNVNLFGGNKDNYVALSNGYAYVVDHFAYRPADSYMPDIEVEGESMGYIAWNDYMKDIMGEEEDARKLCVSEMISSSQLNDSILGTVSEDGYLRTIKPTPNAGTAVSYCLPDVLSGTYDVKIVMLPNNIMNKNLKVGTPTKFVATLTYYEENGDEKTVEAEESYYENNVGKVDTITLWHDFKFPIAYKGISKAYPILSVESIATRNEMNRGTYINEMYIDQIILVSKEE